jgi:hypothetical protein
VCVFGLKVGSKIIYARGAVEASSNQPLGVVFPIFSRTGTLSQSNNMTGKFVLNIIALIICRM